ncbi:MAG: hypothetical protein ACI4DO_07895 [Roseburia sp.]
MEYKDLKEGMKVIDTDDGMVMEYRKDEKSDYFCTKDLQWGVCQFDLSTFEPYEGELPAGEVEKRKN